MSKMKCPYCGHMQGICIDTRPTKDGEVRYRKYRCKKCRVTYDTVETHISARSSRNLTN